MCGPPVGSGPRVPRTSAVSTFCPPGGNVPTTGAPRQTLPVDEAPRPWPACGWGAHTHTDRGPCRRALGPVTHVTSQRSVRNVFSFQRESPPPADRAPGVGLRGTLNATNTNVCHKATCWVTAKEVVSLVMGPLQLPGCLDLKGSLMDRSLYSLTRLKEHYGWGSPGVPVG